MIVVGDELSDLRLEITRQEVVLQQDAVLQGLMPALDLSLGLRMIRRATDMLHVLIFHPFSKLSGYITGSIVREKPSYFFGGRECDGLH